MKSPSVESSPARTGSATRITADRLSAPRPLVRRDALNLCALAVLWLGIWLPRMSGPIDLRFDAGVYYVLGTSLAEGKGYRLLNEPGEIEAVQYPPLLPLMVAAHQELLGTSDYLRVGPWLRISFLLLSGGLAVATYLLARGWLGPGPALLAAAIATLSVNTFLFSDLLYTEVPFALITVLFALCLRRGARPVYAAGTGLLAVAAYLLRTAGLALLAAWIAESLLRRRFRQAALRTAVALLPILLWESHIARVTSSPEFQQPAYEYQRAPYYYSNVPYATNSRLINSFVPELGWVSPRDLPLRSFGNLAAVPASLGETLVAPTKFWQMARDGVNSRLDTKLPSWIIQVALWLIFGLIAAGTGLLARRREWFVPLYLGASIGLVSLTPWPEQFTRYFAPLTPFLAVTGVLAAVSLDRWWTAAGRGRGIRWLLGGFLAGVLAVQCYAVWKTFRVGHPIVRHYSTTGDERLGRLLYYDPPWQALDESLEWVRRHAEPGDVIATTTPHTAFVRTGLKAVLPPLETDGEVARRMLDGVPVEYVILDELDYPGFSPRYAAPAVEGHPDTWMLVYSAGGGGSRVYRRVR